MNMYNKEEILNLGFQRSEAIFKSFEGSFEPSDSLIIKAIETEEVEKGKKANLGEIREWKGKKFQKTSVGWIPLKEEKGIGSDLEAEFELAQKAASKADSLYEEAEKKLDEYRDKYPIKERTEEQWNEISSMEKKVNTLWGESLKAARRVGDLREKLRESKPSKPTRSVRAGVWSDEAAPGDDDYSSKEEKRDTERKVLGRSFHRYGGE